MTTITKEDVVNLREKTGAGLIDCKRALTESGGDFEEAVSILRKKGVASAAKKATTPPSAARRRFAPPLCLSLRERLPRWLPTILEKRLPQSPPIRPPSLKFTAGFTVGTTTVFPTEGLRIWRGLEQSQIFV